METDPFSAPVQADHWDRRYLENTWPREPDRHLVALASGLQPGRALDLACGTGRNAIWLARSGWTVTGVDVSSVGLDQARRNGQEAGVDASALDLLRADLGGLRFQPGGPDATGIGTSARDRPASRDRPAGGGTPFGTVLAGDFDLVVAANFHPSAAERPGFFAMAASALAPGGHLFVSGHHLDNFGHSGPPDPGRLYTPERLTEALPTSLEVERLEVIGDDATGTSRVVVWATRAANQQQAPTL